MPGADHGCAVEFTFCQRPAAMTADVIDGVKVAVDIVDADRFAINLKAFGATGFDFFGFANPDEIRHFLCSLLGCWCKFSFNIRTHSWDSSGALSHVRARLLNDT